jgi:hypothetical protein
MSLLATLEADGQKLETFLANLVSGGKKIIATFEAVSTPTKAVVLSLINDVVKEVASGTAAAAAAETGNIPVAIALSETTISGIKQLVVDAKAGEVQAVADLAAFGIKL